MSPIPASQRPAARRHLDESLDAVRPHLPSPPADGWIRTIRESLGMSSSDLARRMGVTPAAIRQLEESERAGTIKLQTLERAASAMNAELGYVVMPMQSLDAQVRSRAELVARRELEQVNHSMALEDQRPDPHRDAVIVADRVRELVADRRLWVDP